MFSLLFYNSFSFQESLNFSSVLSSFPFNIQTGRSHYNATAGVSGRERIIKVNETSTKLLKEYKKKKEEIIERKEKLNRSEGKKVSRESGRR